MQYKVTHQYAKETEQALAEFADQDNAILFIQQKMFDDEAKSIYLIYRLFINERLFREFNKEKFKSIIQEAQYAEGKVDFPARFAGPFNVYVPNKEDKELIAKLNNFDDAMRFVLAKLKSDNASNEDAYLIYNGKQFIEKVTKTHLERQKASQAQKALKQQKTSFRPTPLPTAPRPGPANWLIDEDSDDDKKKED